jgi:hypothetical protein
MKTATITKAVDGKMYSFHSRYSSIAAAKENAKKLNSEKHAYYKKVTEKGNVYFDVRIEN